MQPLLLTLGEPAGIGPDCVLLAFDADPELFASVVIVAPSAWLVERAHILGLSCEVQEVFSLQDACELSPAMLRCWNPVSEHVASVQVGVPSSSTAAAVIACIEHAALVCVNKQAGALITAPIEKAVLKRAGFAFPGHTEFLANLCGCAGHEVMMLASEQLRVALLTTHVALRDVAQMLNVHDTVQVLRTVHNGVRHYFGVENPRIALCAFNPHAGEQGHFGDEEARVLEPAIAQLAHIDGITVHGPISADSLFSQQIREGYDAMVCCYHDQALIPLKTLSFGDAVNITLGLPMIRTSVDHGTACDIAGSGKASFSSLVCAIRMAENMTKTAVNYA